jgi:diacylglycerol kinase family enzyme
MVSAAIAVYGGTLPPLCILPGGTMNTCARNLGVRGKPEAVLGRLIENLRLASEAGLAAVPRYFQEVMRVVTLGERPLDGRSGQPAADDDGGAGLKSSEPRTRYGCILSAAMGARYLAAYSRRPGLLWASFLGLRTIGSSLIPGGGPFARWLFERTPAELVVDGEPISESAFRLLLCATVPDVGLGFRVPWRAGCVRGRFHLIASSLPITKNALQLLRMQRGQPLRGSPHLDRLAATATVRFATPQPLTLDGELFAASAVTLSLGPPLEILLPP